MLFGRRQAMGLITTVSLLAVRPALAQEVVETSTLMDQVVLEIASPEFVRRQEWVFGFYLEALRELLPEEMEEAATQTIPQLFQFTRETNFQTDVDLADEIREEVEGIYDANRSKIQELLTNYGVENSSVAMMVVERSYLTMFTFYVVEELRRRIVESVDQSSWCFWPVCSFR